jgi:hypothetical protein
MSTRLRKITAYAKEKEKQKDNPHTPKKQPAKFAPNATQQAK